MLIDQDIIPQHDVHRSSILQPIYRCISPDDIVCLDPGDKFIVVMLTVSKNTADLGHKVLWMYCKTFENVVKQMADHHFLPQDGQIAT